HERPRRDHARRRRHHLTPRANLTHLLGVNRFFTDLAGHARTHPGSELSRWWPASRFHHASGFLHDGDDPTLILASTPRPDGHASGTNMTPGCRSTSNTTLAPNRSTSCCQRWPAMTGSPQPPHGRGRCCSGYRASAASSTCTNASPASATCGCRWAPPPTTTPPPHDCHPRRRCGGCTATPAADAYPRFPPPAQASRRPAQPPGRELPPRQHATTAARTDRLDLAPQTSGSKRGEPPVNRALHRRNKFCICSRHTGGIWVKKQAPTPQTTNTIGNSNRRRPMLSSTRPAAYP